MTAAAEPAWVDTDAGFGAVLDELASEPRIAIDTEFHRERTYFPRVALIQIAWSSGIALVDATTVSLEPLAKLFADGVVVVMHAASQDLEVLDRSCGVLPQQLLDTQLIAGFAGYGSASLQTLVEKELGVRLPKGDRLTDWMHRPLDADQRAYAASDVAHLLALVDRLRERLESRGRWEWACEECREMLARGAPRRDPDEAWWRVKEARQLRGAAVGVVQAVAAWRERRAAKIDQPVRFVLPDLALVAIAQRAPSTFEELRNIRGLDERHTRRPAADEILAAVREGQGVSRSDLRLPPTTDVDRDLRPAVALASAWVSQIGRTEGIDTGLIATRADLEALLRGDQDARLAHGWRAQLAGNSVRALARGESALAFDGNGTLVIEPRR